VAPIDALLAPGGGESAALVLCRISALFVVSPTFTSKQVPAQFQVALILLFTLLTWPVARSASPGAVELTGPAVAGEVIVGLALGIGVSLVVGAAEMAGDLIGTSAGLSGAASIDPVTFAQTPTVGVFVRLTVLTLLLSMQMHLVLIDGLAASFRAAPLGSAMSLDAGAMMLATSAGQLIATGLRMASPIMAAILVLDVALGLLAKSAPQLQVMSVSHPLQTGLGLFALGAALPFVASSLNGWESGYDAFMDRALSALAPGGR
jgi:flagellar biosynthesis protein FliR